MRISVKGGVHASGIFGIIIEHEWKSRPIHTMHTMPMELGKTYGKVYWAACSIPGRATTSEELVGMSADSEDR
jgi:hypothetical protein